MAKLTKYEQDCMDVRNNMQDKLKVNHKSVDEILEQVKLTNGRVNKLESWKDQLVGGFKISLLIATLVAFIIKIGWISLHI